MIETLGEFQSNSFDRQFLSEIQPAFDVDTLLCSESELVAWFQNFLRLSQQNIGLAHCMQQHQSARNCLSYAHSQGNDFYNPQYAEAIGCFSTNHDIDTIELEQGKLNGSKYWITAADRADFAVVKVGGHYTDRTRQLIYVDLHDSAIAISNNGFDPIGMEIARPMTMLAKDYAVDAAQIIHSGNFAEQDPINIIQSFAKYAFLTNYLGCAMGLYHTLSDRDDHQLEYDLRRHSNMLVMIYRLWEDNIVAMSRAQVLDQRFWLTYDAMYNMTKQEIAGLLGVMLIVNNSRTYNKTNATAQQFLDAVVWLSHGRSPYQQVMSDA